MPVTNTLGALTTFKIPDTNVYWATTFAYPNVKVTLTTFVESNNSIFLGGRLNTFPNGIPQFIKLTNFGDAEPTLSYTAFYGSNANVEGYFEDSLYDSTNDRTIFVGAQEANRSGNTIRCGAVYVFNANNSIYSSFIDPPQTSIFSTSERTLNSAVLNANGTITASGFLNESGNATDGYFASNYTQTGTKNWTKFITGAANPVYVHDIIANTVLVTSNDTANNQTDIGYLNSDGSSFNNTFTITGLNGGTYVSIDTSDNIYVSGGNGTVSQLAKYDAANSIISWAKQITNPNVFGLVSYYDGNVYASMVNTTFTPGSYINKIISVNSSNGAVNWQNEYRFTGTGSYSNISASFTDMNANSQGIFVLSVISRVGNTTPGGTVFLKLPTTGIIDGTGNYQLVNDGTGNLFMDIRPSSVSIGDTTSLSIGSSNLNVANANAVSTVTSNIAANTTQNYTYSQTLLK